MVDFEGAAAFGENSGDIGITVYFQACARHKRGRHGAGAGVARDLDIPVKITGITARACAIDTRSAAGASAVHRRAVSTAGSVNALTAATAAAIDTRAAALSINTNPAARAYSIN